MELDSIHDTYSMLYTLTGLTSSKQGNLGLSLTLTTRCIYNLQYMQLPRDYVLTLHEEVTEKRSEAKNIPVIHCQQELHRKLQKKRLTFSTINCI